MRYPDRATVCVSTQAGCAMACSFCATGQAGFTRHLTTGEIVEQVVRARRSALPRRLSNVVFMGMGEPLANYGPVWAAVERLHHDLGLSARHLTLSTVGLVPGIRRLTAEALPVNLAVSLHAANDTLRDELVPINRRYPLADLLAACRDYVAAKGRRLSFEWALIDGVNDRPSDAAELAEVAIPLAAHVNLIPLNPTPGYLVRGPSPAAVRAFRDRLKALGVNATVRRNRGTDIDAACGQLAARRRPVDRSVPPPDRGERHRRRCGGRSTPSWWRWRPPSPAWPGESRIADTDKLAGDVALEAFNLTAAFVDADGRHTDDELDAFIDVFGPRFDTVARAASPNAMRAAGLLTGSRTFLDAPSPLFDLLVQADGRDGGNRAWAYYTRRPRHRPHGAGPRRLPVPRRAVRRRALPLRPPPRHGRGRRPPAGRAPARAGAAAGPGAGGRRPRPPAAGRARRAAPAHRGAAGRARRAGRAWRR